MTRYPCTPAVKDTRSFGHAASVSAAVRDIIVVDADVGMSPAMERRLATVGWRARSFSSGEALLASGTNCSRPSAGTCPPPEISPLSQPQTTL